MDKRNVTVRDLAAHGGMSQRQVWRHVKRGRLPKPSHTGASTKASWPSEEAAPWLAWRRGKPQCRELAKALTTLDPSRFYRLGRPALLTVEEVANGERTVWRWVADGEMPGPESGKLRPRLWRTETILAWRAEKRRAMGLPDDPMDPNMFHVAMDGVRAGS